MDREEELSRGPAYPVVRRQTAARYNTMHVYMVSQFLIPGVEYLDDAGDCPEELRICGEFQDRFSTAFVEKSIQEFLVGIKQRVHFMWNGKYHMKIGGVNDLCPALIHPDFFLESLTVRAVTVTAGIIVDFRMSAFLTDTDIAAGGRRFAGHQIVSGLTLDIRLEGTAPAVLVIGTKEGLLDREISQWCHPLTGQKD